MTLEITDAMVEAAIGEHDPIVFKHGTPDAIRDHMRDILSSALATGSVVICSPELRALMEASIAQDAAYRKGSLDKVKEADQRLFKACLAFARATSQES